ncbi:SseB family protein [Streptomyces sp. CA-181903]|uniref:SseB family protein n=1 Tax=Streptomyces sp. CA-181903 TaxID=3240055 RepID=UPI003D935DCA
MWTASYEGVGWIHAFSDEAALARFVMARADACGVAVRPGEAVVDYVTTLGARLLDVVIPAVGEPTGVALDVGGDTPFFLPPVAGVVPDVAVVAAAGGEGPEGGEG